MEDQKEKSLRVKPQNSCGGAFRKQDLYHQETPKKITMRALLKLKNEIPSSSEEQTYASGKSDSYLNGNTSCSPQYVSSTRGISDSYMWPQWSKTARRGRKSLLASASASSCDSLLSNEKEEEEENPSFDEIEAAAALLMLADVFSLDATEKLQRKRDSITKFPEYLQKKRKFEDSYVGYAEDRLARVDKETSDYRDEFVLLDTVKKKNLKAIDKKIPMLPSTYGMFSCGNCGRSFGSHHALGGHKSTCNKNYLKSHVGESTVQGSMRNMNNKLHESSKEFSSSSVHPCKHCGRIFLTGQALGGHQKSHAPGGHQKSHAPGGHQKILKREFVEEPHLSSSSVSAHENVSTDSLSPTNSLASVQEAAEDDITSKQVFMFDLNEDPPKEEDDECIDLRCLELL